MTTVEALVAKTKQRMHSSLEALRKEIATVRTGRAHASILDIIQVEYYGSMMPLSQVASIGVPEPSMLTITPFDKNLIKNIETAILKSELGLNPANDGATIRLPIPALNEERRRNLAKTVNKIGENIKTAIRNVRRDINEDIKQLKKDKTNPLSEDVTKKALDSIQKLTDETIKEVEAIIKNKEADIMQI